MNWLVRLLPRRRSNDFVARTAFRIAQECHGAVWGRVSHRVLMMRLNEARGYVRARAAKTVETEVHRALSRNPQATDALHQEVFARTIDLVVGLVIREVLTTPAETTLRRRAA